MHNNKVKTDPDKIIMAGIFLLYLIFNLILLILHEPWRDEANVWLMARELSPWQLLCEIKYQGHPCFWYFLVMPFAKAGLPFRTIGVLSYLIMALTAGIFCRMAPLGKITKAICLFSPAFSYFYSDIARNYCLIALVLMLLAWQFPERNVHAVRYGVLLGLLVQTDTIAIPAAGLISAMWLLESSWQCIRTKTFRLTKRVLAGIWVPAASLFFWILQFYQVSDSTQFQIRKLGIREIVGEIRNFAYGILIRMTGMRHVFCMLFFAFCLIVFWAISARLRNGWALGIMAGTFLFQAAFSAMVYQLHIWHYISLVFVFIWAIWILYKQREEKNISGRFIRELLIGAEVLLILLAVCMFGHWNSDDESSNLRNALIGIYSDGGNAASFIKENIAPEELIISDNIPMSSTILAHLRNYEFYYAGSGTIASYADWSEEQSRQINYKDLLAWVQETFPDKKYFFIIQSNQSCIQEAGDLKKGEIIYQSEMETVRGEEYAVFRISIG